MGTPIGRAPLVRLFSTVLRKDEDGRTYLVTPVEKVGIRVVDAPFVAVEMSVNERDGEPVLTFRTNVGDVVEAGPDHAIRFVIHGENAELKPYLHVRGRLEALVSRAVMYDLVELGEVIGMSMAPRCFRCARPAPLSRSCRPPNWMRMWQDEKLSLTIPPPSFAGALSTRSGGPVELAWRDHGDHLLNPQTIDEIEGVKLKDAAVLVPVVDDGDEAQVIFTLRTSTLRKHSGQIAFPGGAIDPGDASPEMAAVSGGGRGDRACRHLRRAGRPPAELSGGDRISHHAGSRSRPARISSRAQSARSGRRIRGAAFVPDGSATTTSSDSMRVERHRAAFLPDAL